MDILELIKKDHEKVSRLIKQLRRTSESDYKKRELLFPRLKMALDAHTEAEEELFYPVLQETTEAHDAILEAHDEHRLVTRQLEELETSPKDTRDWGRKFEAMASDVESHIQEEESEIFTKAKRILTKEQRIELGELMVRRERSIEMALR